jgi:hypothetical protein
VTAIITALIGGISGALAGSFANFWQYLEHKKLMKEAAKEDRKNPLVYNGNVYYDAVGHAYCTGCYDGSHHVKRIHLSLEYSVGNFKKLFCSVCNANFEEGDKSVSVPKRWSPLDEF